MTAVLRWRARWLRRHVDPRQAQALRLLPVLLHTSFEHRLLRGEPPGLVGLKLRPGWGNLARAFSLPPPHRSQRGRRLVDALVALPGRDTVEVLTVVSGPLRSLEEERLRERLTAAQTLLSLGGAPIRITPLSVPHQESALLHATAAMGALLAGQLPARFWSLGEHADHLHVGAEELAELSARAPTALMALSLMILARDRAPCPVGFLRRELDAGQAARALADPDLFCAEWAGESTGKTSSLRAAVALASPRETTRRAASSGRPPAQSVAHILRLGRDLAALCATAVRRSPARRVKGLKERMRREVLEAGVPRALLPPLGAALLRPLRYPLEIRAGPSKVEVYTADGTLLGQGATEPQARIRALALVAQALGAAPLVERDPGAPWRMLLPRLARGVEAPALLLVIGPPNAVPGPPFDPLNRGPLRQYGFERCLVINLRAGGRPTARYFGPAQAMERLVRAATQRLNVEVLALNGQAQPAAARVARLVNFLRSPPPPGPPVVEVGGVVLLSAPGRLRRFAARRFAARPRVCTPDPEAPDLALWPEKGNLSQSRWAAAAVQCRVFWLDDRTACVLYTDGAGRFLREEVPLPLLEEHLQDARIILRETSTMLALWVSTEIAGAVKGLVPPGPAVDLGLFGEAPLGLEVEVGGERFGGFRRLGWGAAAEAVLGAWPAGAQGRVRVTRVDVRVGDRAADGLMRLYLRSVALRRIQIHLDRLQKAYR